MKSIAQLKADARASVLGFLPTLIIANTVKGKGASIMENKASWHHHLPNAEEYAAISRELKERKEALLHE